MSRHPPSKLFLSKQGMDLISDREGCILNAYHDSRGILTIGIGHTSDAGPPAVKEGMVITEEEAQAIFREDCRRFRSECLRLVKVSLNQHEFDALASFIFNLGTTQFAGSTALARLNDGDYDGCAKAMRYWNKPPEIQSRREGEVMQFLGERFEARI
jgi:lysozyme